MLNVEAGNAPGVRHACRDFSRVYARGLIETWALRPSRPYPGYLSHTHAQWWLWLASVHKMGFSIGPRSGPRSSDGAPYCSSAETGIDGTVG